MLSLMDTIVSLVVKVLWKLISLICFRVYLEVNVHKNPTCFSRWSVSKDLKVEFVKVPAHSNVKYNELADKLAKEAFHGNEYLNKMKKKYNVKD